MSFNVVMDFEIIDHSSWAGIPCTTITLFNGGAEESTPERVADLIISNDCGIVLFKSQVATRYPDKIIAVMKVLQERDPDRSYHHIIEFEGQNSLQDFVKKADDSNLNMSTSSYYIIMQIPLPSSLRYGAQFNSGNINLIEPKDEIEFLCCTDEDYFTAKKYVKDYNIGNTIFIPTRMNPYELKKWIIDDKLQTRFQVIDRLLK